MTEEKLRGLVVYLPNGFEAPFRQATAYAFTGPNDRDLELVEWDWDKREMIRRIAYFPAGGWIGLRWGELATNEYARRIGFKLNRSESDPKPASPPGLPGA